MATAAQIYRKDAWFWRPSVSRAFDGDFWASVTQVAATSKVSIPATSRAVNRSNGRAAYLRYPFYFEPSIHGTILTQATKIYQNYPVDGVAQSRVAEIYRGSLPSVTSGGNPSTAPVLGVGDVLLAEGSVDNGSIEVEEAGDYLTSGEKPHVGVFATAIVGRKTFDNQRYVWIIPGNDGVAAYSPNTGIDVVSVTHGTDDSLTVTSTNKALGNDYLFPTCCVIESAKWLDRLLYTGGLSSATTLASLAFVSTTSAQSAIQDCPESMTKSAALSVSNTGYILLTGGINDTVDGSKTSVITFNANEAAAGWEVWNPADPKGWALSANELITARRDHQMVVVTDGAGNKKVLVVGGKDGAIFNDGAEGELIFQVGTPINKCETMAFTDTEGALPDAAWQATGSMSYGRYAFGMIKLPDGRVLVVGGIGSHPNYPIADDTDLEYNYELQSCEIYDPVAGSWTPVEDMKDPHSYCVCNYIPEANKVYVYGGYTSTKIEYLDLSTMTWRASKYTLPSACVGGAAINLDFNFCGLLGGGAYDTDTDTFTANDDVTDGSSWNSIRTNVPEYTRYDGLNAEWVITDYDDRNGIFTLDSNPIGDFTNTNIRWSDADLDSGQVRFVLVKAVTSSETDVIGPFSFDLEQPFSISGTNLVLDQDIKKGMQYSTITVASGASGVSAGYLLFQYGYQNQTGPVKCYGHLDDLTLMVDAGFKFPADLDSGSSINVLYQRAAYQSDSYVGSFWLTASNAGRAAAIDYIKMVSAAGIQLDIVTRYPGDRGIGNEGYPISGNYKLSDIVECFGRDDVYLELEEARAS